MRPGHIRVFDGLRLTTEHLEHFQGSLHSALQDIRAVLGLGKVYSGFEVIAASPQAITVQPGLAFDFQRNRIVCDEPKTLEVEFGPEEEAKYLCLKYDQVEDGQVEGHYTLIWDSCDVLLQATMPEPEENLLPIAKLSKLAEGENGSFEIISLVAPEESAEPKEASTEMEEPPAEEAAAGSEDGETSEESATLSEVNGGGSVEGNEASAMEKESAGESLPESEAPAYPPGPWRLKVQQGVVRLAPKSGNGNYLNTVVLESLQRKLNGKENLSEAELLFTLAEKEVALDFPVDSLTCRALISGSFGFAEDNPAAEAPATGAASSLYAPLKFQATAEGEVTCAPDGVLQFGLTKTHYAPGSESGGMPGQSSELTETGIAHLSFGAMMKMAENQPVEANWNILPYLQLRLRVDKTARWGFKIICNLLWKGGVSQEIIQKIATAKPSLIWETLVAWKALGESEDSA